MFWKTWIPSEAAGICWLDTLGGHNSVQVSWVSAVKWSLDDTVHADTGSTVADGVRVTSFFMTIVDNQAGEMAQLMMMLAAKSHAECWV